MLRFGLTLAAVFASHSAVSALNPAAAEPQTAEFATPIKAYQASYEASYKGIPLKAVHKLERSGNQWVLQTNASGFFGQIDENSTFSLTSQGDVKPIHYLYQRSVMGHNRKSEILHNHQEKLAVGKKDDKRFSHPLTGNEQDQGSYMQALRVDLARGKSEMCYPIVEQKRIDQYCFKVSRQEKLATSIGELDTLVVDRVRQADSPRQTRFWFAPQKDYLLVKLDHREAANETAYSLIINQYQAAN